MRVVKILLLATACLSAGGCVRRTLTVETEPQGALVWLNDEEIGRSPVTVDFLWYGDYSVIARLDGYATLDSHRNVPAPWYQWPGIDFITEVLYPGHIHDHRNMRFLLVPEEPIERDALLERAAEFREQALAETE